MKLAIKSYLIMSVPLWFLKNLATPLAMPKMDEFMLLLILFNRQNIQLHHGKDKNYKKYKRIT